VKQTTLVALAPQHVVAISPNPANMPNSVGSAVKQSKSIDVNSFGLKSTSKKPAATLKENKTVVKTKATEDTDLRSFADDGGPLRRPKPVGSVKPVAAFTDREQQKTALPQPPVSIFADPNAPIQAKIVQRPRAQADQKLLDDKGKLNPPARDKLDNQNNGTRLADAALGVIYDKTQSHLSGASQKALEQKTQTLEDDTTRSATPSKKKKKSKSIGGKSSDDGKVNRTKRTERTFTDIQDGALNTKSGYMFKK